MSFYYSVQLVVVSKNIAKIVLEAGHNNPGFYSNRKYFTSIDNLNRKFGNQVTF